MGATRRQVAAHTPHVAPVDTQMGVLPTEVMADRLPIENRSANFRALMTITGVSINDCRACACKSDC